MAVCGLSLQVNHTWSKKRSSNRIKDFITSFEMVYPTIIVFTKEKALMAVGHVLFCYYIWNED